ncbi:MAG: pectinesterase family protein [Spirosomataceae bacterium]
MYLGRPWRDYAQTVFINCQMSKVVKPRGLAQLEQNPCRKPLFMPNTNPKERG